MKIDIRSTNVPLSDALRDHTTHRLRFALRAMASRLDRVVVRLVDVNGPKGGPDKVCRMDARLLPAGRLLVEATDALAVRREGLTPWINLPDEDLIGLYAAADAYVSLSRWEGHNLGIDQALAMGLPVLASDIPAHRAFGVEVVKSPREAAASLRDLAGNPPPRLPRVRDWRESCALLAAGVEEALAALGADRQ